jgi:hypothetical protein
LKDEDDGVVRFCIEADNICDVAVTELTRYPENLREAIDAFKYYASPTQYKCVWLSEYGEFVVEGIIKHDWIYYLWTDAAGWRSNPFRFQGYARSNPDQLHEYYPISRDGKRITG